MKMHNPFWMALLMIVFFSCNASKRAAIKEQKQREQYKLFQATHRGEFATDCAENFKPNLTQREGKTVTAHDTVIVPGPVVKCPPTAPGADSIAIRCPDCKTVYEHTTRVDTFAVEDVARLTAEQFKLRSLTSKYDSLHNQHTILTTSNIETKRKASTYFWVLVAIGVVVLIKIIYSIKKRVSL